MQRLFLILSLCFLPFITEAQDIPFTPAAERLAAIETRQQLARQSLLSELPFTNVGPSVFGGRVSALAVNPQDPTEFYVAYASGGLWHTNNNGAHFTPLFDDQPTQTIGDIAVDWKHNIVWVGTGEVNSSRSSYAGIGMFKSSDGGKSWTHRGLPETHHIGRIRLHPTDTNTVWVAALGHLYSANEERGVFKTTDGGKSWQKTLFVNPNCGAVDLLVHPNDPNTLFSATWQRERRAWNFIESGEGSGIHRSTDGGLSWERLNLSGSGFPFGDGVGRIGLAMHASGDQTHLYAIVDNYNRRPKEKKDEEEETLQKDQLRTMNKDQFLRLDNETIAAYLKANRFPDKYNAEEVIKMVESDKIQPLALVEYLEDVNSLLFDTPVIGAEVYHSSDLGKTWNKTHEGTLDDLFYSYGYYFGQIRVDPSDAQHIYIVGVPVLRSSDGGKTFESINEPNVHVDHHALWINPNKPGHLILGNDGGVNISYDNGDHWYRCHSPAVGQFYTVEVDHAKPYRIYGGLQDNGVWVGPSNYKRSTRWQAEGDYPYDRLLGGDGMQIAVDKRDNETVYTAFQFGNWFRIDQSNGKRKFITPKHELGERPLRWNWQAPLHLSIHNPDILYIGSNKVHRSLDQGDNFTIISDDLTKSGRKGDVAFGTLTSIHESPLQFGLVYAGSDDGRVHVSKIGGYQWEEISTGLPPDRWVSRVQASAHERGRVYVSLNGYRQDDMGSYLYRSEDFGQIWEAIGPDLPAEPVNVIKEDALNPDLLYVGTDQGLYISLDRGRSFLLANKGLPAVAIHDLIVQPEAKELVLATHGRSFYKTGVGELQQLTAEVLAKNIQLFDLSDITHSLAWGKKSNTWRKAFEPKLRIPFFVKEAGKANLEIRSENGLLLTARTVNAKAGLNFYEYEMSFDPTQNRALASELKLKKSVKKAENDLWYLPPGTYEVVIQKSGSTNRKKFAVKERK